MEKTCKNIKKIVQTVFFQLKWFTLSSFKADRETQYIFDIMIGVNK